MIDDVHSEKRSFVRMHVDTLVTFTIKVKPIVPTMVPVKT